MRKYFIFIILFIILDQITKQYFMQLSYYDSITVIGEYLKFVHVENPGMAFGISFGWGKIFLSLFSVVASIGLFWLMTKLKDHHTAIKIGFALIAAGASGNLIDRVFYGVFFDYAPLFYGRVIDFIQVDIPDVSFFGQTYSHFPIFNIADSCVSVGMVTLLLFNKHIPDFEKLFKRKVKENIEL